VAPAWRVKLRRVIWAANASLVEKIGSNTAPRIDTLKSSSATLLALRIMYKY